MVNKQLKLYSGTAVPDDTWLFDEGLVIGFVVPARDRKHARKLVARYIGKVLKMRQGVTLLWETLGLKLKP